MKLNVVFQWFRLLVLFRSMARLPFGLSYLCASLVGRFDYYMNRADAQLLKGHMHKVLSAAPAKVLKKYALAHHILVAREILDIYRLPRITAANGKSRISLHGLDVLKRAQQNGKGVILAMAHYGRPVMLSTGLGLAGESVGFVTQITDARNPNLTWVRRKYLQVKMHNTVVASRNGRWIQTGGSMLPLFRGLKKNETVILLFDLPVANPKDRIRFPFLGGTITVSRGIQRIAEKTGSEIIFGVARDNGRQAVVELRALPHAPHQAMRSAVAELEKDVRSDPWQWWQWRQIDQIWTSE